MIKTKIYKAIAPSINQITGRFGYWLWATWEISDDFSTARVVKFRLGKMATL